jgi:hypothetical protein
VKIELWRPDGRHRQCWLRCHSRSRCWSCFRSLARAARPMCRVYIPCCCWYVYVRTAGLLYRSASQLELRTTSERSTDRLIDRCRVSDSPSAQHTKIDRCRARALSITLLHTSFCLSGSLRTWKPKSR